MHHSPDGRAQDSSLPRGVGPGQGLRPVILVAQTIEVADDGWRLDCASTKERAMRNGIYGSTCILGHVRVYREAQPNAGRTLAAPGRICQAHLSRRPSTVR